VTHASAVAGGTDVTRQPFEALMGILDGAQIWLRQ